ncbi:MAG TPA: hypothetical protein VM911_03740 [Pyrinomonadaceae bacterium]|jgi:hypothetical protein|nr:hypothetical protein [Pyrinomonadaceae bacterium]
MDPTHLDTEPKRSTLTLIVALLCALAITAALFGGYLYLRRRHAQNELARQQSEGPAQAKPTGPPLLQVYEDDAMLKGGQATISGTVVNISPENMTDISIELELRRRNSSGTEVRALELSPKDLTPEQQGRYTLTVQTRDFSNARLLRIKSSARPTEIVFKTAPGAQRPPERPPQTNRTVIVPRPTPRKGEEEFINTPDNPARVP